MKKMIFSQNSFVKVQNRYVRILSVPYQLEKLFYTQEGLDNNISFLEKFKKKHSKEKKKKNAPQPSIVIDEKVERFNPEYNVGLTAEQVAAREKDNLANDAKLPTSKTYRSIFFKNIFTFFNMLWLIIVVALLAVGAYSDLLFVFVIVANTAISIIQEIRAKNAVEKLSMITLPMVTAIRDGKTIKIPSQKLVLDDIIVLTGGNQIPSDCIVIEGSVDVNESLLTGESNSIQKPVDSALLSGSYVVAGRCHARVDRVGSNNYINQMATKAKEFKAPQSNLFKDINRLIKYIGIALVPIGILTFLNHLPGHTIEFAIKRTSGSLTSMIPSGMFLLVTISLAIGVIKLAKKKTLVRDLYSIEMLARTNVLCLDKTGTITDGTMKVVDFLSYTKRRKINVKKLISNVLHVQKTMNSTAKALIQEFGKSNELTALNIAEFASERKYSITQLSNKKIYFLGSATNINCPLTDEHRELIKNAQEKGLRVMAFAEQDGGTFSRDMSGKDASLLALIVLEETIRDDAIETIQWFKDNGVEIKIISGDAPETVSKIASRVGVKNSDKYVSLENASLKDIEQMADEFTVFGRVTPEQKYTIVKALKNKGKVVSMTGDGVNDTLALKEADCSIAMADGSEVARNISKIVLLESNFSSLPSVVKEGRQVINNVQNSSSLFLMKTFFAIILTVLTLFLPLSYPFEPRMMLLLEAFVIGLPSLMLTFEPNTKPIKGNFIPQVMKRALPRALLMLINIIIVMSLKAQTTVIANGELTSIMSDPEYTTICVLVMTYTGFLNLVSLCIPANLLKWTTLAVSFIGTTGTILILPKLFHITESTFTVFITFFSIILVSIILIVLIKLNRKRIDRWREKIVQLLQKT
ncbi:MAG: HAD-IC family P-type ATPase [Clostridia bacterium]|nr:HAD-IC family P-type ATPase [Clostridia bacterium]